MNIYLELENSHPKIKRGIVWCKKCGAEQRVENGLKNGWPTCHGETMTIDSPQEQIQLSTPK